MAPFLSETSSGDFSDLQNPVKTAIKQVADRIENGTSSLHQQQASYNNDSPRTLVDILQRTAKRWPEHGIAFKKRDWDATPDFLRYADLLIAAEENAAALRSLGVVQPRQCTVQYFDNHWENVVWYWSIIAAGGVPVLLSPLSSNQKTLEGELENLKNLFGSPTILTANHLAASFQGMPSAAVTTTQEVTTGQDPTSIKTLPTVDMMPDENDLATVLFTSGSTGHAKGVEYTHNQLVISSRLKSEFHGMDADKTFMSWVGFDHSAALCEVHLQAMLVGASQVMVPAIDLITKPVRFLQALSDHRVSYTFAPNFFIAAATKSHDELSDEERKRLGLDLSGLRVIMCGGEANKTVTLRLAEDLFTGYGAPACSIKASYGLSETCSALFYNVESPSYDIAQDYLFASAGKHLPQHELRIIDEAGQPVSQDDSGSIQVRGPLVFQRYFNNEMATKNCKTNDGWFDTGDLGQLNEQGNLRIMGRSKEILIINGQNYSSFELEYAIESANIPGLNKSFTASFSLWIDGAESEDLVVLFNPVNDDVSVSDDLYEIVSRINEACIRFCRKRPHIVIPLPRAKLPKSSIGKLSRSKLKKSYEAGHFDDFLLPSPASKSQITGGSELTTTVEKTVARILSDESKIEVSQLHLELPVADLDLDSLSYLRIKRTLETTFDCEEPLQLSQLLSCTTVRDLVKLLLSNGRMSTEYDPAVPLATSGSKQPLILCPPGGGGFWIWMNLLKYLPDRPVLALRSRGLQEDETPFQSLEEMLDAFVAGIQRHYPHGPYALLGVCFGGMLAFELGKRFEAAGEKVVFCAGIDNPPDIGRFAGEMDRAGERKFLIDLVHFYKILPFKEARQLGEELKDVCDAEFLPTLMARIPAESLEKYEMTVFRLETWSKVHRSTQQIASTYRPTGYISSYDEFWCAPDRDIIDVEEKSWRNEYIGRWSTFVSGSDGLERDGVSLKAPLQYHRVNGNHYTVLSPENVEELQEALHNALKARGI